MAEGLSYVDASGYIFHRLSPSSLAAYRISILQKHTELFSTLTGTILLAPEGLNVRLSGSDADVAGMKQCIADVIDGLPSFVYKDTRTSQANLPRFLVKVKKHLIAFPVPMGKGPVAKSLKASELKR